MTGHSPHRRPTAAPPRRLLEIPDDTRQHRRLLDAGIAGPSLRPPARCAAQADDFDRGTAASQRADPAREGSERGETGGRAEEGGRAARRDGLGAVVRIILILTWSSTFSYLM